MSSFVMLKPKQAKHVQQGPNSIWLLTLRKHENKLKSKTDTKVTTIKYDTQFWGKLFHSFKKNGKNSFFLFNIALYWQFQVFSRLKGAI